MNLFPTADETDRKAPQVQGQGVRVSELDRLVRFTRAPIFQTHTRACNAHTHTQTHTNNNTPGEPPARAPRARTALARVSRACLSRAGRPLLSGLTSHAHTRIISGAPRGGARLPALPKQDWRLPHTRACHSRLVGVAVSSWTMIAFAIAAATD